MSSKFPAPLPRWLVIPSVLLGTVIGMTACAAPPPVAISQPSPTTIATENPWEPLPDASTETLAPWIQEFLPLPPAQPYGDIEITETSFSGEWDLALVGQGEASRYSTGLIYRQWREESRIKSGSSIEINLISPDGQTELLIKSTQVGGQERLRIEAKRSARAGV